MVWLFKSSRINTLKAKRRQMERLFSRTERIISIVENYLTVNDNMKAKLCFCKV